MFYHSSIHMDFEWVIGRPEYRFDDLGLLVLHIRPSFQHHQENMWMEDTFQFEQYVAEKINAI